MLTINNISLRIAGQLLLANASLDVADGAKVGLVGRNGSGKTTLFRAITGELAPESGSISLNKGARIGRLEQEAPDGPETLINKVLAADSERAALLAEAEQASHPDRIAHIHTRLSDIGAHSAEARAARILHGLGFDNDAQQQPCAQFSGGWRMRIALAGLLFSEPDLLLLDEPTNYLDLEGTLWLERYIAKYPRTVVIISHDRDLLNKAVNTIAHLSQQKLRSWRGGYDQFERQRREQQALQEKMRAKQDSQRRHMEAFVNRFRAKATKARQAQSRLKALEKLQPIAAIANERVLPINFSDPTKPAAPPIVTMENVSVGYQPDHPVLRELNLRIDDDDRIGLLGINGNGKSTFAKLLASELSPESGRLLRSRKLEIAYFGQHQLDLLIPERTPVEHVRARQLKWSDAQVRARVAQFGLSTQKMDTAAQNLSGGEKARLLLGLAALGSPHLLILDEPTNHLDVDSREALIHALNDYSGSIVLISHDRHLIESCVDRLWLVAGGTVEPFEGDLGDYRRIVLGGTLKSANSDNTKGQASQREVRRLAAKKRETLAPILAKIKECEDLIADLERKIRGIDTRLADTDLYLTEPDEAARLAQLRAQRAQKLERAEEVWLELNDLASKMEAAE